MPPEAAFERQTIIDTLHDTSLIYLSRLKVAGGHAFASVGLTYGQALLLTFVRRGSDQLAELSELLGMVRPALSTLITNLVDMGLIERQSDPHDARRFTLRLTRKGVEACEKIKHAWRANFPVDLNTFSDEELQQLIKAARIASQHGLI